MTEWDALLEAAANRGYPWHLFRTDRHGPEVLAGVFQHHGCADVIVFSGADHACAHRLPTDRDTDVFTPARVYWWYAASPVWTLRALLTLPAPGERGTPTALHPADLVVEIALGEHRVDGDTLRLVVDHPDTCLRLAAAIHDARDKLIAGRGEPAGRQRTPAGPARLPASGSSCPGAEFLDTVTAPIPEDRVCGR